MSSNKKIIQVPMEEELVAALEARSKKEGRSRAELIREACRIHLRRRGEEEMDRVYVEGYIRFPEDPTLSKALDTLAAEVISKEEW